MVSATNNHYLLEHCLYVAEGITLHRRTSVFRTHGKIAANILVTISETLTEHLSVKISLQKSCAKTNYLRVIYPDKKILGERIMAKTKKGGLAVDQLKSIIARVEKLEEEKTGISADIRDVFAEAKGNGFDIKAIRTIIKMRKMDAQEREEQETVLETYLHALDMLPEYEEEAA
jgi:uncharacterized protein (UPF0335 family)